MDNIFNYNELASALSNNSNKPSLEEVKKDLEPLAIELNALAIEKDSIKAEYDEKLSEVNKKILDKESVIRKIWGPYIQGVEKASMKIGNLNLTSEEKLSIKVLSNDDLTEWFLTNGYEGVMKYSIHHKTAESILKSELKDNGTFLDCVEYKSFNTIKIK